MVKFRDKRLDVQHRSFVKNIHVFNFENVVFDTGQSQHGQTYCVGAPWNTCGKNAVEGIIKERGDQQGTTFALVKIIGDYYMRESFDIFQAFNQPGVNFDPAADSLCSGGLYRHSIHFAKL